MDLLARMLSKNPASRITIPNVKLHPYFKDIDWELLAQKKVNPPILLTTEQDKNQGVDEEEVFLKIGKKPIINHNDHDYTESNKTLNRVKQFTFVGSR
jgi:serine/threonine protein kinase